MIVPRSQPQVTSLPLPRVARNPGLDIQAPRMDPNAGGGLNRAVLSAVDTVQDASVSLAGMATEFAARRTRALDSLALSEASLEASRALVDTDLGLAQDGDWRTHDERWTAAVTEIGQRALEKHGGRMSAQARAAFEARYGEMALGRSIGVRTRALERGQQEAGAVLDAGALHYAQAAAGAGNEATAATYVDTYLADLSEARIAGWITPAQEVARSQRFLAALDETRARALMRQDPELAQQAFIRGDFGNLDPLLNERLRYETDTRAEAASNERVRARAEQERLDDQARKDAQTANAADLRAGIMNGTISETVLTDSLTRRDITLTDFNGLLGALRTASAPTDDTELVLQMLVGIREGWRGTDDVLAARGAFTTDTVKELLGLADEVQRRGGPLGREDVRRDLAEIDALVGGDRTAFGALLNPANAEKAINAQRDYIARVRAGDDPATARQAVLDRFRPTPPSLEALGRSPYWQGPRGGTRAELVARLDEAKRAVARAKAEGALDPAAEIRELRLLVEYQRIIERMAE